MKRFLMVFILLFFTAGYAVEEEPDRLLREIDRNLNPESYESYRKIINIEPDGRKKEYVLFSLKKGVDKMIALFLAPASDKGRSTLRLGDNMWLYVPNVGKPIRITSLQSVIGGVFNNADILALDYSAEYKVERLEIKENEYLLHLKARTRTVAYDRIRLWAEKQKKIPVRIDCLTEKNMLIKTLNFKNIKDFTGGIVRPSVIETVSPLYKGYRSIMIFSKIKQRTVGDEVFTLTFMPRADSLR
jgi:outer membrane lipoprotein-sorting protein